MKNIKYRKLHNMTCRHCGPEMGVHSTTPSFAENAEFLLEN